jgi:hypothetical protein
LAGKTGLGSFNKGTTFAKQGKIVNARLLNILFIKFTNVFICLLFLFLPFHLTFAAKIQQKIQNCMQKVTQADNLTTQADKSATETEKVGNPLTPFGWILSFIFL